MFHINRHFIIEICRSMLRLHTLVREWVRERERDLICNRDTPNRLMSNLNWRLLHRPPTELQLTTCSKFANFYISKFRISFAQSVMNVEYTNCPSEYDTKQSNGEVPVMLGLWGMRNTPSLLLLPGPLWSGVIAPDMVLSMG